MSHKTTTTSLKPDDISADTTTAWSHEVDCQDELMDAPRLVSGLFTTPILFFKTWPSVFPVKMIQ